VSGAHIAAIAVAAMAIVVVGRSAVIVPAGSAYVVERLGRYQRTLGPGFNVVVPLVDAVRFRHSLGEQAIPHAAPECRTRDARPVWVAGRVTVTISQPQKASYQVAADLRPAADAWGVAVVRYEITDISRHNKESAA
jgi:regulator of protease activity HflC (stomatin/prohibitin superfamily)